MMDDKDLEKRMSDLRDTWRVAGAPPLDRMWQRIETEAFAPAERGLPLRWVRTLLPFAAMLALGFGLGQFAPKVIGSSHELAGAGRTGDRNGVPARIVSSQEQPFVGVANDYLERVTALLVTLASESRDGRSMEYAASQAKDLLGTTRLLMDSPDPINPHLRGLLDDLELVLAQIARLPARPDAPDVYLIDQALDQRDVIPRLRVFMAENTTSQP
jgi:hypothetical protein